MFSIATSFKYNGFVNAVAKKFKMSCSTIEQNRILDYEQLLKNINSKSIYLIDVREKQELQETGILPDSLNIPVGEIKAALSLPDDRFEQKYGRNKPTIESKLVFSCRSGARSDRALKEALNLGYNNAFNYSGGWLEWEKHTKAS